MWGYNLRGIWGDNLGKEGWRKFEDVPPRETEASR